MKGYTVSSDRRVSPRFGADFPVKVQVKKPHCKPSIVCGRTVNVSRQGLSLILDEPLPLSLPIALSLELSPSYPSLQTKARVIWSNPLTKGKKCYCGVRFLDLHDKNLTTLYRVINDIIDKRKSCERRKGQRREKIAPIDFPERRRVDRRLRVSIFRKCVMTTRVDFLRAQGVFLREVSSVALPKIILRGRELIMFGCCNYLGLATHPKVKKAAAEALEKYGMSTSSSRIAGGTMKLHSLLEQKLAEFEGGEDCITYDMGYLANLGCIPALVTKNDFVITDAKSHASIIDGCFLSGGTVLVYKHNDMRDLEKQLKKCKWKSNKLIVTDGVFSMDGDIARLDVIHKLAQEHNAAVMVDDAHAVGVLGENGTGTCEYFNLRGKIDIVMGTLSKALPGLGGFIVARKIIVDYLRCTSRPFIFNLSLPPSIVAGLLAALEVIKEEPELRQKLWRNVRYLRENMQRLGYNTGNSESAIIPVIIGNDIKTYQMVRMLEHLGIFVDSMVYPAVRKRESRLRLTPMATHSPDDLQKAIKIFEKAGRKLDLI
ncbi:2-amino-3-ketobutyrate coenzyme A ligase [subsurface metagenome]